MVKPKNEMESKKMNLHHWRLYERIWYNQDSMYLLCLQYNILHRKKDVKIIILFYFNIHFYYFFFLFCWYMVDQERKKKFKSSGLRIRKYCKIGTNWYCCQTVENKMNKFWCLWIQSFTNLHFIEIILSLCFYNLPHYWCVYTHSIIRMLGGTFVNWINIRRFAYKLYHNFL